MPKTLKTLLKADSQHSTEEFVLEANPDFVIVGHSDYLNKDFQQEQGWEAINAVQNENVYFLDENLANNWGTTTVQLVSELSNSFEESANKTNEYSDVFTINIIIGFSNNCMFYIRRKTKEKVYKERYERLQQRFIHISV